MHQLQYRNVTTSICRTHAPKHLPHLRTTRSGRDVSVMAFAPFSWLLKPFRKDSTATPSAPNAAESAASTVGKVLTELTAVPELSKQQLEDSLKYAVFASLAYEESDQKIKEGLAKHLGGKYKDAPFKRKKHTGTLWQVPGLNFTAATDTEVLALRIPHDDGEKPDMMVIAFRGTETSGQGSLPDILTDLLALRSHIGDMEGVPATKYPKNVEVHRGFLKSFNDVIQQTEDGGNDALTDVRDELMGKGVYPETVVICGHSLGAALATMGAFWLKTISPKTDVYCYAYASPRVGNKEWADAFNKTVDKGVRFIHKNDVVPAVPASQLWTHVDKECFLVEPKKGTYGLKVSDLAPGAKYKALWAKRPRFGFGQFTSTGDHSMDLYIAAIEDALKHT
eukprot:GHUV01000195.1.p1 GENE.GHUV01000195.1~~GHUV01000195.1.p1  ORF type:complete len:394 (+),score=84.08 GHUV01000195.1:376-1557(+)